MDLHSNATHIVGGLPPPPGVTPNFVNPENLHKQWILSLVTCFFPPTFFILIRVYTKLIIMKSHGWEDCKFCLARAWICSSNFDYWQILSLSRGYVYPRRGIYSFLHDRQMTWRLTRWFKDWLNRLSRYWFRRFWERGGYSSVECANRTSEDLRTGKSSLTMVGQTYTEQTLGSQCQRNRQRAGHLHHKALNPSPTQANIRPSQERRSILLHSHYHLAEPILLLSRHAGVDLYMYPPAQNLGTLDTGPLPRYLKGRLCFFNN